MTPEAQRIAIAEACGWKDFDDNDGCLIGVPPHNAHLQRSMAQRCVPDYLNDLNAMHEAEKVLTTDDQQWQYVALLVGRDWAESWAFTNAAKAIHAVAAQRAEAFLRTLGLWKDDGDADNADDPDYMVPREPYPNY